MSFSSHSSLDYRTFLHPLLISFEQLNWWCLWGLMSLQVWLLSPKNIFCVLRNLIEEIKLNPASSNVQSFILRGSQLLFSKLDSLTVHPCVLSSPCPHIHFPITSKHRAERFSQDTSLPLSEHEGAELTHSISPQRLQGFALCNRLIRRSSHHAVNSFLQKAVAALLLCCLPEQGPQLSVICIWHAWETHSKPGNT